MNPNGQAGSARRVNLASSPNPHLDGNSASSSRPRPAERGSPSPFPSAARVSPDRSPAMLACARASFVGRIGSTECHPTKGWTNQRSAMVPQNSGG